MIHKEHYVNESLEGIARMYIDVRGLAEKYETNPILTEMIFEYQVAKKLDKPYGWRYNEIIKNTLDVTDRYLRMVAYQRDKQ